MHPDTAFLVSNQFLFLAKKTPSIEDQLIQLAIEGLNSIYPAVVDKMIIFLIEFLEKLVDEHKETLISTLEYGASPSSHIFWYEKSIPFVDPKTSNTSAIFGFKVNDEEINNIAISLDKNDNVSAYDAWQYLQARRYNKKKSMSVNILETLLQYREVFLRQDAAYRFIVENGAILKLKDIEQIFGDEHPSVVFEGMHGCVSVWNEMTLATKEELEPILADLIGKKSIAIRANNLMTTFAKDYTHKGITWDEMTEEEKKELWRIWGKLFPIFIEQVPYTATLNTGRFGLTMETSLEYLDHSAGMKILEAWYYRIDARIRNGKYPDEYEMSVANDLMVFTKDDFIIRQVLIGELLSYPKTNFLISNIKWIVSHWADLDISEKSKILSLVNPNRQDVRWIRAVLLNTYLNPPPEIQFEILGKGDFFDLQPQSAAEQFPSSLLMDCLKVYFGHPQPLWWLAVHHNNVDFWSKIVRYILYKKKEPFYMMCVRELVFDGVNGFSRNWKDGLKIWRTICRRHGKKEEQAKWLIYATASCSCSIRSTRKMWKELIKAFQRENKEKELIVLIAQYIEVLQQTGRETDIFEFFDYKYFYDKIYPAIQPDKMVIDLIENLIHLKTLEQPTIELLRILIQQNASFRFFYTPTLLKHVGKKWELPNDIISLLDSIPTNYKKFGKENINALESELQENIKIDDWID